MASDGRVIVSTDDCIFCKIASGSIPSLRIHETPELVAFLDVNPLAHGHVLIIPRQHYENLLDAPPKIVAALAAETPRLAKAVLKATGATGLNLLQNTGESSGQAVFHLHFHLIPRLGGDGLGYRWNAGSYSPGEAETIKSRLIEALRSVG